jgi:ferric iron reductase protein FhuF
MTTTSPIAQDFEWLNTQSEYLNVKMGTPEGTDWYAPRQLMQPASPQLETILDRIVADTGVNDRQFLATNFISAYSWQMTAVGVSCFLAKRRVPDFSVENILVHFNDHSHHDGLAFVGGRFYALSDDPEATHPCAVVVEDVNALREIFRSQIEAHMSGIEDVLKARTRMDKRGLWGIVADRLCGMVIYVAEQLGQQALCPHEVGALVQVPGSPLKGKTGLMMMEYNGRSKMFLQRGSCCQYYKVPPENSYCSTCPLLSLEERERRLRDDLMGEGA